jgi:hypothetical protein
LSLLAKGVFLITSGVSQFLTFFAEKIGMQKWSTICVVYDAFKVLLLVSFVLLALTYILYKFRKNILKPVVISIALGFIATTILTSSYEKTHISVDVIVVDEKVSIVLNYDENNMLVGNLNKNNVYMLNNALNSHNGKTFDTICLPNKIDTNSVDKAFVKYSFGETKIVEEIDKISFCSVAEINVIDDAVLEIVSGNKIMLIINSDKIENGLEIDKKYDIITIYGQNSSSVKAYATKLLKDEGSQICVMEETDTVTVYLE